MSEARERYYKEINDGWIQISRSISHDYVSELEQQKAELEQLLIASRRANNSLKASYNYNRLQKLEQQNKELMEFAKEMREIGKLNPDRLPEYTDIIYHHANDLITRITGGE